MNLRGTIPAEIGMLSRLTYLDLCETIIEIPFAFFASFKNSHTLCVCILPIAGNYLRGSIPSQFGLLQELEHLELSKHVTAWT